MRNSILTIIFILSMTGPILHAQTYQTFNPYDFNRTLVQHVNAQAGILKEGNVASRTFETLYYSKDGKLRKSSVSRKSTYTKSGQLRHEILFKENGKVHFSASYEYNENGQVIRKTQIFGSKQKSTYVWEITYHNDSLISTITNFHKGKQTWGYRYIYSENNLLIEQRSYHKNKLTDRIEFDYYPDLSKKEVRYYKDSLKLEKTFRYDCGIANSLLSEKQKDTLTRCTKKEELEDGTVRRIEETRDEKGRIVRTIYDHNAAQKWSETRYYDSKNRLRSKYHREVLDNGQTKIQSTFYRKGKEKETYTSLETKDEFGGRNYQSLKEGRIDISYSATYTFHSSIN